jgi:hypothetical protein
MYSQVNLGRLKLESEVDVPPITMPSKSFYVKHEKSKLPTFYRDVRKYFIFKSDFQHAIEHHCSERDAITVLRYVWALDQLI